MDAFPLIVLVGILVIVGLLVLLARFYPGTGADLLDWQPTRSYETEVELEMQDVEQMIEAQNEYRRKRGETGDHRGRVPPGRRARRGAQRGRGRATEESLPGGLRRALPLRAARTRPRGSERNSSSRRVTRVGSSSCG